MNEDRGVWHSKSGAKGQTRSSASHKPASGALDKKESQPGNRGGIGRGQGASKERGGAWQAAEAAGYPVTNSTSLVEERTPVNSYNARAVEAALKAAVEPRPSIYKPAERPPPGGRSAATPWGSKPNCMANGKDFWVDLRKQFTALQRSGGAREGG